MTTYAELFAGIGGGGLGIERALGAECSWQCEIDPFCQTVLENHWPSRGGFDLKRWHDVCSLRSDCGVSLEPVDLLIGGFPCQDVSAAGKGEGLTGSRSVLWFEFRRILHEFWVRGLEPRAMLVENVASGAKRWVTACSAGLAELGYRVVALPLSAEGVGAPHLRRRVFLCAWKDALEEAPVEADAAQLARSQQLVEVVQRMLPGLGWDWEGSDHRRFRKACVEALKPLRGATSDLYPTPAASSYSTNQGGAAGRVGPVRKSLGKLARDGDLGRWLWPTPVAQDASSHGSAGYPTDNRHSGTTLTDATVRGVRWPTPAARDWKSCASNQVGARPLNEVARRHAGGAGVLNPAFVEALMGFPPGWVTSRSGRVFQGFNLRPFLGFPPPPPRVEEGMTPADDPMWRWWVDRGGPLPVVPGGTIPGRPSMLRALGNAEVPQCAELAALVLCGLSQL